MKPVKHNSHKSRKSLKTKGISRQSLKRTDNVFAGIVEEETAMKRFKSDDIPDAARIVKALKALGDAG